MKKSQKALLVAGMAALMALVVVPATAGVPATVPAAAAAAGNVRSWGYDLEGSRYAAAETTITPHNVSRLRLKWVFAVPTATGAQSQPAVVGNTLYFGGTNGVFYALNATTGKLRWRFNTARIVHVASNPLRDGPAVSRGVVYFGDNKADLFALDARTGKLRWIVKLDSHPAAVITGSPVVYHGRVIVGVSSVEELFALVPAYPCCTFRGSLVALDAQTGRLLWRHYMVPKPSLIGVSKGVPHFGPAGVAVWTTPAVDPRTGTIFVGTGNDYIGTPSRLEDSIVAIEAATGAQKWATQLSDPEAWNFSCVLTPGLFNCPVPGSDFDFGSSPNVFTIGDRTVVGEGQKSGLYHVLDASTGKIVWQDMLSSTSLPPAIAAGLFGIEWGTSYDGKHIYVATNIANPGTMFALSPATGRLVWKKPVPKLTCLRPRVAFRPHSPIGCLPALPAAVSSSPGLVWEGGQDGILRAYSSADGRVLWSYDTVRRYRHTTDGVPGFGGSIDGGGTVIAHGMVYSNSGYTHFGIIGTEMTGNVLLAFALR